MHFFLRSAVGFFKMRRYSAIMLKTRVRTWSKQAMIRVHENVVNQSQSNVTMQTIHTWSAFVVVFFDSFGNLFPHMSSALRVGQLPLHHVLPPKTEQNASLVVRPAGTTFDCRFRCSIGSGSTTAATTSNCTTAVVVVGATVVMMVIVMSLMWVVVIGRSSTSGTIGGSVGGQRTGRRAGCIGG